MIPKNLSSGWEARRWLTRVWVSKLQLQDGGVDSSEPQIHTSIPKRWRGYFQHFELGSSHVADFLTCFLHFSSQEFGFEPSHSRCFIKLSRHWVWTMFFLLRFLPFVKDCIRFIRPYCMTWTVAILFPWFSSVFQKLYAFFQTLFPAF